MEIKDELKRNRVEYKDNIKKLLNIVCEDIFSTYEGLNAFSFKVYQPSYNDGDPIHSRIMIAPEDLKIFYTKGNIGLNTLENTIYNEDTYEEEAEDKEMKTELEVEITEEISERLSPFTSTDIEYLF